MQSAHRLIECDLSVGWHTLWLGGAKTLRIEGHKSIQIRVPAGCKAHTRLRLQGVAMPDGPADVLVRLVPTGRMPGLGLMLAGLLLNLAFFWVGTGFPTLGGMVFLFGLYMLASGRTPFTTTRRAWLDGLAIIACVVLGFIYKAWLAIEHAVR